MKLWEVIKGKGLNTTCNLCGYPLYRIIERRNLRERNFCQGLISSKKFYDHTQGVRLKEFLICGVRISQYGIYNYRFIFRIFGITLYDKDICDLFYQKYKSKIPTNTDYLFFLTTGMGEFSLFLSLCLKQFIKQHNIHHPLFIVRGKGHMALLNIFYPTAKIIRVEESLFSRCGEFKVNNIRARHIFPTLYFQQVEENIKTREIHFFEAILDCLQLKPIDFIVTLPQISTEYQEMVEGKLKSIGLINKKFIFITPEANSCVGIGREFWGKLVDKLRDKGFEVVFNPMKMPLPFGCFTANFSLQEAFLVAQKAQAVIGLRSGLLDLLSMTGTPIHVIYTSFNKRVDFPSMSADHVRTGFDLAKLPSEIRKSEIYSYFYYQGLIEDIIKKI